MPLLNWAHCGDRVGGLRSNAPALRLITSDTWSTSSAYSLTVHNTASPSYALKEITIVVVVFLPLVLLYQAWTYYVFRRRVSRSEFQPVPEPRTPQEQTANPDRIG